MGFGKGSAALQVRRFCFFAIRASRLAGHSPRTPLITHVVGEDTPVSVPAESGFVFSIIVSAFPLSYPRLHRGSWISSDLSRPAPYLSLAKHGEQKSKSLASWKAALCVFPSPLSTHCSLFASSANEPERNPFRLISFNFRSSTFLLEVTYFFCYITDKWALRGLALFGIKMNTAFGGFVFQACRSCGRERHDPRLLSWGCVLIFRRFLSHHATDLHSLAPV